MSDSSPAADAAATRQRWPDSEAAWKRLAANIMAAKRAQAAAHWAALRDEDDADADLLEPMDPEEEETLF